MPPGASVPALDAGEPAAYRYLAQLCSDVTQSTSMAVTFTTHGHRLTPKLVKSSLGAVHFVRLSVDGIGATYERLRGRPFAAVVQAAGLLGSAPSPRSASTPSSTPTPSANWMTSPSSQARWARPNFCSYLSSRPRQPPVSATPRRSASSSGPRPPGPGFGLRFPVPAWRPCYTPRRPSQASTPSTRTCTSTRPASCAPTRMRPRTVSRGLHHGNRAGAEGGTMRIWNGYGSEHSMRLVLIGRFQTVIDAKAAEERMEALQALGGFFRIISPTR
ncbi:DUF6375 family protein [Streptomyces thermolilacinus]|uniref:DUF6375 family protein n=1 Tax=Streptomyces thermolilacinus TaxID=285540 RepID=UPI00373FCB29